ncbi:MAG TPA: 2-succinyl-5-enolpyruvyl-6-hydroxy-3-cyclohexene-1-carboxylic-acid synthase, partial [Naasia sp.]
MPDGPNPASRYATTLLARLVADGVRHLVVAPGSRSQALALAAAELEAAARVRLHVRIDERVAGFLALGLAVESGAPVAVIVTSGTAVAELHPAMLEAWHSGVPLIAITADRPEELRGIAANQTTEQPGIFGPATVWSADVAAPGDGEDPSAAAALADAAYDRAVHGSGPVHLNVAFRDPLSAPLDPGDIEPRASEPRAAPPGQPVGDVGGAVVIAGSGAGSAAEEYARAAGLPLLAEVTSGARFGPNLVPAYRAVLRDPSLAGRIRHAIVFGRPNLSREVPALLARPEVAGTVVAAPGAQQFDPARTARIVGALLPPESAGDEGWLREWVSAGRRALVSDDVPYAGDPDASGAGAAGRLARAELAALRAPVTRRALAEAVWRATWPHDRLVL